MLPAHRKVTQVLPAVSYNQLKALERAIVTELEPVDTPLEHHHIPGVYVRKLSLPAGTALVGKIHTDVHICIVAKGRILVTSEQGGRELVAGDVFVSPPGVKRAGYCIEDTVFINVHTNPDNETDQSALEAKLIAPEALEYKRVEVLT